MNPAQLVENRSVRLIFRDCLKLAGRMVDNQSKTQATRALIKQQFVKNRDVIDQD
jgi:Complex 1 protein (LYR family)